MRVVAAVGDCANLDVGDSRVLSDGLCRDARVALDGEAVLGAERKTRLVVDEPDGPTACSSPSPLILTGVPQPELGGEPAQATVSGTPGLWVRGLTTLVT